MSTKRLLFLFVFLTSISSIHLWGQCEFTISNDTPCAEELVNFNVTNPNGNYAWDFDEDGIMDVLGESVDYFFPAAGNSIQEYVITLYRDGVACPKDTIDLLPFPDASIGLVPGNGVQNGNQLRICSGGASAKLPIYNASSTYANNTAYEIDWGDGAIENFTNTTFSNTGFIEHEYFALGYYNIKVTTTNIHACTAVENYIFYNGSNPSVGLANPGTTVGACAPVDITFPLTNTGNNAEGTQYLIFISDSLVATFTQDDVPNNFTYTFLESSCGVSTSTGNYGNAYDVKVIANNPCGSSQATIEPIEISSPPLAEFIMEEPLVPCVNQTYTFTNSSTGINEIVSGFPSTCETSLSPSWLISPGVPGVDWNLLVGNLFSSDEIQIEFTSPGVYTVEITVNSAACGADTFEEEITIFEPPNADANISLTSTHGDGSVLECVPSQASLINQATGENITTSWNVNPATGVIFLNGTNLSTQDLDVEFTQQGAYTISLLATNICATDVWDTTIVLATLPEVDLQAIPDFCENAVLDFDASNVFYNVNGGTFSDFSWTFSGATPNTSSDQFPTNIVYNATGEHIVELTTTNQCGSATTKDTFFIQAPGTITLENDKILCKNDSPFQLIPNPLGGTWSGTGLAADGTFTPANANLGDNKIYYTYQDNNCTLLDSMIITTTDLPNVNAGNDTTVCADDAPFLLNGATPAGGTWSVDNGGIITSGNVFDPFASGVGTYIISYSYTDNNSCTNTNTKTIIVHALPNVEAGPDQDICENPNDIPLTGFNPAGGTWTGTGVTPDGVFNVSNTAGIGTYQLYYSFTNSTTTCSNIDSLTIHVVSNDVADAGANEVVCLNDDPFSIASGLPVGGTWAGTGVVSGEIFDPSIAGVGLHSLTYTYGVSFCQTTDTKIIEVLDLPNINIISDQNVCEDGATIDLSAATPVGGIWSGNFISNDSFDPVAAGVGVQTLTYSYTDLASSCSNNQSVDIDVKALPQITINDTVYCRQIGLVDLPFASPNGGTWSGAGIVGNQFDPINVGVAGGYKVYYSFTNQFNCTALDSIIITTIAATVVDAGADTSLCIDAAILDLNTLASPAGGRWELVSGAGLNGSDFNPAIATAGDHVLKYILGTGNCQVTDEIIITVNDLPIVEAGNDVEKCYNSNEFELLDFSPIGGEWSGAGTDAQGSNTIDPSALNSGQYTLYYNYEDANTCNNVDSILLTIHPLPVIEAGNDTSFCDADVIEHLSPASPVGGTWSGVGIVNSDGQFNPQVAGGAGIYQLYYTYTEPSTQCLNIDSIIVTVVAPSVIDAGADDTLCINQGLYLLHPITPQNGIWSGNGLASSNRFFDPTIAGDGTHTLTYSLGTGSCRVQDEMDILVVDLSWMTAGEDESICVNEANITLTGQNPIGGIWSGAGIVDAVAGIVDPSDASPGIHILTYTYTDPLSDCEYSDIKEIEVFPIETPRFTIPETACVGDVINFQNNSNILYTASWNFGDGNTSDVFDPTHTYTSANTYSILLIIENEYACIDSVRHNIFITEKPNAFFIPDTTEACVGIELELNNQSSGYDIRYNWDFGNDSTSTELQPNFIYYGQGVNDTTYIVSLETYNQCGSDFHKDTILIHPIPVMEFGMSPESDCSPVSFSFANTSTGSPESYFWDFGNGQTSTDSLPDEQVYYADSINSIYTISLIGTNKCGTDTAITQINVEPADVTAFFEVSALQGCQPLTVEFNSFATPESLLDWNFGDGNTSSELDPVHTFPDVGEYKVVQYANNDCGYDSTFVIIKVIEAPEVAFQHEAYVCLNQPIYFENQSINTSGNFWDFGDGDTSVLNSPSHIYTQPGTYQVSLTGVSAFNQCPATYQSEVIVRELPKTSFTPDINNGCTPLTVNFENNSQEGFFYEWNFGDENTSIQESPEHRFTKAGTYQVSLIATDDNGCFKDTSVLNIIAYPSPEAIFDFDKNKLCGLPAEIDFTNQSNDARGYQWSFGDGEQSTLTSPTHTFETSQSFDVQLIVQNTYNCADTVVKSITTYPQPKANFEIDNAEGCSPLSIQFNNTSTNSETYYWNFGDGDVSNVEEEVHTYEEDRIYSVFMVASIGDACFDTIYQRGLIQVHPTPFASFSALPTDSSFHTGAYELINHTTDANLYFWDFGDGETSEEKNPTHQYTTNSDVVRQIYLEASSYYGCVDDTLITLRPQLIKGLHLPNGFSPEQGVGDVRVFKPKGIGIKEYLIQVYSPYGQLLWKSTALENGQPVEAWDGTYNGKLLPQDVYVWKCFALFEDGTHWLGQKDQKGRLKTLGSVILLR